MSENKKTVRLLVIALVFGVAAAGLAMLYLNQREAELVEALRPKSEMVAVVVASRDLVKGDRLDASTLSVREIPAEYVNPEAIRPDDFAAIEGEVLVQNLAAGRPLLRSFIGREFPLDFSDTIPEKRRAMTIQVDEINSIAGLIRPGNHIDLFINLPPGTGGAGDEAESSEVVPVLENVEVLATGQDTARDYEEKVRILRGGVPVQPNQNYTTLTINVTAKEAALLNIAQDKGDLMALLRNRRDGSGSGFTKVSTNTVRNHAQVLAEHAAVRAAAKSIEGGLVVGDDGVIRTRDGKVLANQNLVVAEDGTIMTRDGVVLSGRGLSVNENGELVTADGRVVDPDKLVVAPDGTVMTGDGGVLPGSGSRPGGAVRLADNGELVTDGGAVLSGVTLNDKGKVVLADGTVVDPSDLIVRDDGTVLTKDGKVVAGVKVGTSIGALAVDADGNVVTADGAVITGATLTADGKLQLADGTVVDAADVVVNADGSIGTRDGKALAGVRVGQPAGELTSGADGDILTASGAVIRGAKLREDGKLVLKDGTVVDAKDLVVNADGTVATRDGTLLAGVSARNTQLLGGLGGAAGARGGPVGEIDYIVGGVSEDSVAKVKKLPVAE